MNVQQVTPILNVSSLEESFAWFEKLGWAKAWDFGDGFGAVRNGKCEIFLCQDGQGSRAGPVPPRDDHWREQSGTWMSWFLDSPAEVDAAHALAVNLGMVVPWPPTDMPWNVREFHLRHPDGHTFRVGAGLECEEAG